MPWPWGPQSLAEPECPPESLIALDQLNPAELLLLVQRTVMAATSQALTLLGELSRGQWDSHCPCQVSLSKTLRSLSSLSVQPPTSEKGESAPRSKADIAPFCSDCGPHSSTLLFHCEMCPLSIPPLGSHGACHRTGIGPEGRDNRNLSTQ